MGTQSTRGFETRKKTEYPLSKPIIVTQDSKVYARDPAVAFRSQSTKFTHEPDQGGEIAISKKKKRFDYHIHYKISNEHPLFAVKNDYKPKGVARFLINPSHNMRQAKA